MFHFQKPLITIDFAEIYRYLCTRMCDSDGRNIIAKSGNCLNSKPMGGVKAGL